MSKPLNKVLGNKGEIVSVSTVADPPGLHMKSERLGRGYIDSLVISSLLDERYCRVICLRLGPVPTNSDTIGDDVFSMINSEKLITIGTTDTDSSINHIQLLIQRVYSVIADLGKTVSSKTILFVMAYHEISTHMELSQGQNRNP